MEMQNAIDQKVHKKSRFVIKSRQNLYAGENLNRKYF